VVGGACLPICKLGCADRGMAKAQRKARQKRRAEKDVGMVLKFGFAI